MKNCCFKLPYRHVTHAIFDLDGTLLDTECLIVKVLTAICEENGKEFPEDFRHKTAGAIVEDIAKMMIKEMDLSVTIEEFRDLYNAKFEEICSDIEMMPGAERLVRHFHENDVPVAVATSSTEHHMVLKTQSNREVFELFHHIVCGGSDPEVKRGKPAPDIYQVCALRFDDEPEPEDCLVFEDAINGIKGALAAGMQAVLIPVPDMPYDLWKIATLRLDSLELMAPELFGLPAFEIFHPVPKISFSMHFAYEDDEDKKEGGSDQEGASRRTVKSMPIEDRGEDEDVHMANIYENPAGFHTDEPML